MQYYKAFGAIYHKPTQICKYFVLDLPKVSD